MSPTKSAYWQGFREGSPFVVILIPYALLFGVVATESGLNVAQVLGMSFLVIAGASQFAALSLMTENAPTAIILATALAVNLRMAMYSASLVPHIGNAPMWQRAFLSYLLVDQTYALSIKKFEDAPGFTVPQRIRYFLGTATLIVPLWYIFTWVGAVAGQAIPPQFALDFAVPICFLAILAPMLRTAAHMAAAFVSIVAALALAFLPYNLWLLVAAALAMMTGARVELWLKGRQA